MASIDSVPRHQFDALKQENADLRHQLDWLKRQVFGQKSERRLIDESPDQAVLGEGFLSIPDALPPNKKSRVAGHERESKPKLPAADESAPFFDDKVPVEVITVTNPEIEGLSPDQYEVIGEKVSHRLAQRPGSYVVLKYVRQVIKLLGTQTIACPPAPVGVIEGSRADVSFMAGMLIDKFAYHLPLYRQHQRLAGAGVKVSRAWLTQIAQTSIALLEPIFNTQLQSIRNSRVKLMDETPIKAGVAGPGKMKQGQMWPVMGEQDEICFMFFPGRGGKYVSEALGEKPPDKAVLHTDGYTVYAKYAQRLGITHAQCWAHCRREFFEARGVEPERVDQALEYIGKLYEVEAEIRDEGLDGQAKLARRQEKAEPVAHQFFAWIDKLFDRQGFLPSSPFTKAMAYARERKDGLSVYLRDADVAIDTNAIERALRVIPMGRRNWLFCWTELGAHQVGIMQSLLVTCKLQGIDPYDYLVDVLQRISEHPASGAEELTPRRWKEKFAANPLRSPLHQARTDVQNAAG